LPFLSWTASWKHKLALAWIRCPWVDAWIDCFVSTWFIQAIVV
jgi:hypothetical protein